MWQFTSNISVSPIMHLWGAGQVLVEIWMPDMESTAARAPTTQQSHLSHTHAHTDTAVFLLINKKWKHEVLAGWPLKSLASKSSAAGFLPLFFRFSSCVCFCFWGGRRFIDADNTLQCRRSVPEGKFNITNLSNLSTYEVQWCEGFKIKCQSFWRCPETASLHKRQPHNDKGEKDSAPVLSEGHFLKGMVMKTSSSLYCSCDLLMLLLCDTECLP